MNKQTKTLLAAGILAALQTSNASAHLEPKSNDGMEKCYGVAKAGQNDCASKANKHSCKGMSKTSSNINEWVKMPNGLCDKLVGGSTKISSKTKGKDASNDEHSDHNH